MSLGKKGGIASIFVGTILVIVGVVLLLGALGILRFSVWQAIKTYWTIVFVLIGIAIIFKIRWLGIVLVVIGILLIGFFVVEKFQIGKSREFVQSVPFEAGVKVIEAEILFGGGELNVSALGSDDFFAVNKIRTSESAEPKLELSKSGETRKLEISRRSDLNFSYLRGLREKWDLKFSRDVVFSLSMNYGASDVNVDLRNLKVKELEITAGVSSTEIVFDEFPTKVKILAGASDIRLKFPKEYGVSVKVNEGASSVNLNGFRKDGDKYFSDGFDVDSENIVVVIDAGASRISGKILRD